MKIEDSGLKSLNRIKVCLCSHESVSLLAHVLSGQKLGAQHTEVVLRGDSFHGALSHAVLFVTVKAGSSIDILDALLEADWDGADLETGLVVGLIIVIVFILDLQVKVVRHREELGP